MAYDSKSKSTLASGHRVEELSEEDNKRMVNLMPIFEGFVRIQPGGWFYGNTFQPVFDKYYEMKCRANDVFVIAQPKSGTSWTLEIVWTLVHNPEIDNPEARRSIDVRAPHVESDHILRATNMIRLTEDSEAVMYLKEKIPGKIDQNFLGLSLIDALEEEPRVLKTHLPMSLLPKEAIKKSKLIYVLRDPRDVIVSGYYFFVRWFHNYQGTLDEFIDNFLNSELYHLPYWSHIKEAYEIRNLPNVLILYYEDMKADPFKEYSKISNFLDLKRTPQQIQNIAEYTNFVNMKKMAKEGKVKPPLTDNGRLLVRNEHDVLFFRKGVSGGWKDALNGKQIAKINAWMEKNLEDFPNDFRYKEKN